MFYNFQNKLAVDMLLHKYIILVGFLLLNCHIFAAGAACKGSVIFYWKENPQHRLSGGKIWGVLEKEIKGNRPRLSSYMDTNNTFSFTKMGDCCWEVYRKNGYKGGSVLLIPQLSSGYGGIPGFNTGFRANSLKKIPC